MGWKGRTPARLPSCRAPSLHVSKLTSDARQLPGDVHDGREPEGHGRAQCGGTYTLIALPTETGKAPGVGPGEARDRERPTPVRAVIGERLEQGVPHSRPEPVAVARLIARAAVHECGQP